MLPVLFLLFLIIFLVGCALMLTDGGLKVAVAFSLLALVALLMLVFSIAPRELGESRVPDRAEEFTTRLSEGRTYQLIASHMDGSDAILLMKEQSSRNYYAIRVNAGQVPLHEHSYLFTLIKGKLVEVK